MQNRTLKDLITLIQKNDSSLTKLNLCYKKLYFKETKQLAKAIKDNDTLKNLQLTDLKMGSGSATQIALALKKNKKLKKLDLSSNRITYSGAKALAAALKINHTLKVLDLGCNKIDSKGATALAEALKVNKTLTNLGLSYNKIRLEGVKALAESLKINKTLETLFLEGDHIDRSCMLIFSEVLVLNKKISFLVIGPYTHPNNQYSLEKCALEKAATERNLIQRVKILHQAFPDYLNEKTLTDLLSKNYTNETVHGILSFVLPRKIPTLFFSAAKTIAKTCDNNWDPTEQLGVQEFRKESVDTLSPRLQAFFKYKRTYKRFEETYFVDMQETESETHKRKRLPEEEPTLKKRKL